MKGTQDLGKVLRPVPQLLQHQRDIRFLNSIEFTSFDFFLSPDAIMIQELLCFSIAPIRNR